MNKKNWIIAGIGAVVAVAAGILLVRKNKGNATPKPPKKAPQLPLENPGDQSEFTTAASESDLG
jgi:hypothetical protein